MRNVCAAILIVATGGWCWGAGAGGVTTVSPSAVRAAEKPAAPATEPAPGATETPEAEKTVKLLSEEELKKAIDEYRKNPSAEDRAEEALTLNGQVKDRSAELLERIAKGKPEERLEAIEMVGFARKPEVTAVLLELTKSTDAEVARRAVDALGTNGDPKSLETLEAILNGQDNVLAGRAAIAMGTIGDASALPAMMKAAEETKDPVVQLSALRGLGLLKDKAANPLLEKLYKTENPLVQAAVLDAANLINGDNPLSLTAQLDDIAKALKGLNSGWETQMAQAGVTDSLDRMIREAEKSASQPPPSKKRQTSNQNQQQKSTGGASTRAKGNQPAANENAPERPSDMPTGVPGANPNTGVQWGNLPPAVQEEVTAALKSDMPERYRRFLEIYYKILAEGK